MEQCFEHEQKVIFNLESYLDPILLIGGKQSAIM